MRPLQRFSAEYLESIRKISPDQVVRFLDEFRQIHAPNRPSRLISMRIPVPLLVAFKNRCELEGTRYQTRIKQLMAEWLGAEGA
jgi:predicted DNA binding CopG/RHH family protein